MSQYFFILIYRRYFNRWSDDITYGMKAELFLDIVIDKFSEDVNCKKKNIKILPIIFFHHIII